MNRLEQSRKSAEKRYLALPDPGTGEENLRLTSLAHLLAGEFPAQKNTAALPAEIAALNAEEAALLILRGASGALSGNPGSATFLELGAAVAAGHPLAVEIVAESNPFPEDKFAQRSLARWQSGLFLHIPAGQKLAKPLRFVEAPEAAESHYRHVIVLEEGAEASLVLESWSDDASRFVGGLLEIRLGKNSKLHFSSVQNFGAATEAVLRQRLELHDGAELHLTPICVGAKMMQVRQEVHLAGRGSSVEAEAAARGDLSQHFDFWVEIKHEASHSRSLMNYWFVMADQAKGVFNGLVDVAQGAVECESSQKSKSLLLSPKATVHSMPKLLIRTDAVKCGHGASISNVNPEQIHYLQSRGIPKTDAERMIVAGFTTAVVSRLPLERLRSTVESRLEGKHGGHYQ